MTTYLRRRTFLAASGAAFAMPAQAYMPGEGPDTPKICLGPMVDTEMNVRGCKRFRQIGITHVILGNSGFPWSADMLKAKVQLLSVNEAEQQKNPCRKLVTKRSGKWALATAGENLMELLTY